MRMVNAIFAENTRDDKKLKVLESYFPDNEPGERILIDDCPLSIDEIQLQAENLLRRSESRISEMHNDHGDWYSIGPWFESNQYNKLQSTTIDLECLINYWIMDS